MNAQNVLLVDDQPLIRKSLRSILESIDELRYYRRLLFPSGEGPTSEECRAVAEEISAHPTSLLL